MSSLENRSNEDEQKSLENLKPPKTYLSDLLSANLKGKRLSLFGVEENAKSKSRLPLEAKKYILKELENAEKSKPKPLQ